MPRSKSESVTPNRSPNPSRRPSVLATTGDDAGASPLPGYATARMLPRDEQVRQERQRATARVNGLRKSLADLSDFSSSTTGRLDDSYYSVLEKLGALQSTAVALKELAGMAREGSAAFERESGELAGDISSQLDSVGQFDEQETRIGALRARVDDGRSRIQTLSGRVAAVRARIEAWERADGEWQERTRRRLKVGWMVTSSVVFALMVLFAVAQYVAGPSDVAGLAEEELGNLRREPYPGVTTTAAAAASSAAEGMRGSILSESDEVHSASPNDKLRLFDEL